MRLDAHSLLYSGAVQHRRPPARAMLETCGWASVYTPLCPERDTSQGRYMVAGRGAVVSRLAGTGAPSPCSRPAGRLGFGAMPDDEADLGSASGSASSGPGMSARRVLEPLSAAECMQLLADGGLGRLVYNSRYGPTALPTVYRIDGESIVLGTWDPALFDEDLRTGIAHAEYKVAVEADQIDLEAREGWIVLVRGAAHHLDTEAERAPIIGAGLEPWIEGVPAHFIRVNPTSMWGNRVLRA